MKQLQLDLKERLLIVESENANEFFIMDKMPAGTYKIICKGSDITEDIARGLIPNDLGFLFDGDSKEYHAYPDYKNIDHPFEDKSFDTALESFISAIESKGYHWGESKDLIKYKHVPNSPMYKESESRTFNPEKCLIFEII